MTNHSWFAWLLVAVAVLVGGVAFWKYRSQVEAMIEPVATDAGVQEIAPPATDAGQLAEEDDEPTQIIDGEELLRKRAASASSSKELTSWLASPGIIQRIAAAVRLIEEGKSPRPVLQFIEIQGDFEVVEEGGKTFIAPAAYARYDVITRAFTSFDAKRAAKAYVDLKPWFERAFRQVARPGESFDDVLQKAILRLASLPIPEGKVELIPVGAIYHFKDPALESLSQADKHLLRVGPQNAATFQAWLRTFASNVGMRHR